MKRNSTGAVLAATVLALAGCGTPDTDPAPPTPPSPTASPSPTPTVEETAVRVYESMWAVVAEASHEGESDHPDLERYAMGEALAIMRQALEGAVADGVSVEGEPVLSPEVVEVSPAEDPDTVQLLDCMDATAWIETGGEDSDDDDSPVGHQEVDATVVFDGLAWRVSELRVWEAGTC